MRVVGHHRGSMEDIGHQVEGSYCSSQVVDTLAKLSLADPCLDTKAEEGGATKDSTLKADAEAAMVTMAVMEPHMQLFSSKATDYLRLLSHSMMEASRHYAS